MSAPIIHYLALGDSYTIGEAVPFEENFPNRLYHLAGKEGIAMERPRIVAKTGWTTDELLAGIEAAGKEHPFREQYDLVTLLIGVNNQYRGRSVDNYREEFEALLDKAVAFAGGKKEKVIVISIPDWSVTPFAEGREKEKIAREIDLFNETGKMITRLQGIHYIYITEWTREAAHNRNLVTSDGLHPSAPEYERWSLKILEHIKKF